MITKATLLLYLTIFSGASGFLIGSKFYKLFLKKNDRS